MRPFPYKQDSRFALFKKLNSPAKIQDFLNTIPFNFETNGDTCKSPLRTLTEHSAQCMEGAMLAAAILWYHGERPLILDLRTNKHDFDHVVTLFTRNGLWGAISKTNHAVLRYRDPVYTSVRELVMSYFHEYFTDDGKKTLVSYSAPYSLLCFSNDWLIADEDIWYIPTQLDDSKHIPIAPLSIMKNLRPTDQVEREYGKIVEWKKKS